MKPLELRDHAEKILQAVAKDIHQPQTELEQSEKSKGQAMPLIDAAETAAETHAVLRARDGFDIAQMTAEYRALRASVLRRWVNAYEPAHTDLQDMIRFNEAIDQAIAESVSAFSVQVEQGRNFFLGMLGHDMRSPLSAILLSASYLSKLNVGDQISDAAKRITNSGHRMQALLEDLVDFNRTKLGLGINITPTALRFAPRVRHWPAAIASGQPDARNPAHGRRQRPGSLGWQPPATTARQPRDQRRQVRCSGCANPSQTVRRY